MSGIEDLQHRVVDAESRFGLINEQHVKYSERLIALMNAIEGRMLEQRDTIERQAAALAQQTDAAEVQGAEVARQAMENEQLRAMLHSLLRAIESDSRDVLAEAMQELESKVSVLVSGSGVDAPEDGESAADDIVAEDEAPAIEAGPAAEDIVAEDEAPAIEAEPAAEDILAEDETSTIEAEPEAVEALAAVAPDAVPETAGSSSASLAEIMARVSRLVEETEEAGFAEHSGTPEAAPAVDETAMLADNDPTAAAI